MQTTLEMPRQINSISEAKAHFSAIVDEASEGRTFVICRAGRPLVVVSRYRVETPKRRPNSLKGKIWMADDFDAMPDGFAEAFS